MLISQRAYARSRKERGLPGGTLSAVQKALESERIKAEPGGRIDPEKADRDWLRNTSASQSRAVEPALPPRPQIPASNPDFQRGAQWMAMQVCASARRAWPKFVSKLNLPGEPGPERTQLQALWAGVMLHLLEEWLQDHIAIGALPAVDWSCFGNDAPAIQAQYAELSEEWRKP